jgi:DNA-binding winged helix-turn-helix (wHTH) protein/tetratricopeptide (TPR) repeat protein
MREDAVYVFSSFQLDVANASLRRGKRAIFLTPKALSVLRYLLEHASQLVTKDDLWRAVWPEVSVTDATLSVCVAEIRKALADNAKTPRYLETVHRLGYRFIAPVSNQPVRSGRSAPSRQGSGSEPRSESVAAIVVGRDAEILELNQYLDRALNGERQIVFVTGEPGIGKTTLVETFLEQIGPERKLWIGRGQCIEHYGAGEAYLPLLDALSRVCRAPDGHRLVGVLDQHAPTWLLQMPALLSTAELEMLRKRTAGTTRLRMLRELAEAVAAITAERPIVIWLEDLQWSDHSTIEWLSFLARRQEPADLLVLGTYRPVHVILREHPLKALMHELQIHGQCQNLPLGSLNEAAVMEYLTLRFGSSHGLGSSMGERAAVSSVRERLRRLAHTVYQRTDGNPLFVVNLVDNLVQRQVAQNATDTGAAQSLEALVEDRIDTPPSIVQMIERNLERLNPDEQTLLEAASIAGVEFSVASVAAALQRQISEIESSLSRLSREQQFVQSHGTLEWPDGTLAARFRFLHVLYRDVLYDRVPPGHRIDIHRRIAERQEEAYGENSEEISVELAHHYRLCANQTRALKYLELAGKRATARHAYHEAEQHYRQALAALQTVPESPERLRHELSLLLSLGHIIGVTRGYSSEGATGVFRRAMSLAEHVGGSDLLPIFYGLSIAAMTRGDLQAPMAINHEMLEIARRDVSSPALFLAHVACGSSRHFLGNLVEAREHFSHASGHYDDEYCRAFAENPAITRFVLSGATECHLGYFDRALHSMNEALELAQRLNNPVSLCMAYFGASRLHQLCRNWPRMFKASEEALRISTASHFPLITAVHQIHIAHSRAQMGETSGAAERIREALAELASETYYFMHGMFLGSLTEVYLLTGNIREAMVSVEEAVHASVDVPLFRPELLSLRGEVRLRSYSGDQAFAMAEQDFRAAIDTARAMNAKWDELRATTSLAKLLRTTNQENEARIMLAEVYKWFTEGFGTANLREAKALLDHLNC